MMPIMKYGLAALLGCLIAAGCATQNANAPKPTQEMADRAKLPLATIREGHSVYLRKCGECHELMLPDRVTDSDWHVVVPGMAWNAGISRQEEDAVLQYLIAAKSR